MNPVLHSVIAILAVINPFVCSLMILEIQKSSNKWHNVLASVKAMLSVLLILIVAALSGHYILSAFGISMDAFKIVGGIIISFIGFQMLSGKAGSETKDGSRGIMNLIMFAASPGTIAMVITLSVAHHGRELPWSALMGIIIAIAITLLLMIILQLAFSRVKPGGMSLFTRFMGLIIVAMGLQFVLDGIKLFFAD